MQNGIQGFLDECRNVARLRHLAYSTEQNYLATIRRFIYFHGRKHPSRLGVEEIRTYLSYLAVEGKVTASTHSERPPCYNEFMRNAPLFPVLLSLAALSAGCSTNEAPAEPAQAPSAESAPSAAPRSAEAPQEPSAAPAMGGAPRMGAPMMGAMGDPNAPLTPTPELDKKVADAEKAGDKKQIGSAYAARGDSRMNDEKAGARIKYRKALEDFRKALAADPKNEKALASKAMIENIYRQMGRPVPGEEGDAAAPARP